MDTPSTHHIAVNHKSDSPPQYGGGVSGSDPEKGEPRARKMSRIGGPISGIVGGSDADSEFSVGKQLELEQTNSIKYRTCSWQKVHCIFSYPRTGLWRRGMSDLSAEHPFLDCPNLWIGTSGHSQ